MNVKEYLTRNNTDMAGNPVSKGVVLERFQRVDNVGDYISVIILDWMLKKRGLKPEEGRNVHLFGTGSILGFSRADGVVWGSGVLDIFRTRLVTLRHRYVKYDIRAVRGPLTREILSVAGYDCSRAVFGDPGILMPLIFPEPQMEKRYKFCVVNHFVNEEKHLDEGEDTLTISAGTNNYKDFIRSICSAETVISSSLHGIILAEAYHIPAIWLLENLEYSVQKYYDYYYSTDRYNVPVARSVEEARHLAPPPLPVNLENMQQALMEAFPYDLWPQPGHPKH